MINPIFLENGEVHFFESRNELELTANSYRDAHRNEFTQVTASCPCGRGAWIRLSKSQQIDVVHNETRLFGEHRMINPWAQTYKQLVSQGAANSALGWDVYIYMRLWDVQNEVSQKYRYFDGQFYFGRKK